MAVVREQAGSVPASSPEPVPSPTELLERARELAPLLVQRQAETEDRTFYASDVHARFQRAGFHRMLVPRRYGGYETDIGTFLAVVTELARACPSTGWMYCLGATHAVAVATLFDEPAQAELFAGGDFVCPATIVPSGTARRGPDGRWRVTGTWNYCSGAPYGTHFLGHALAEPTDGGPPRPVLFVAPRQQWRRLDDWGGQLGLRGSGSHSITVDADLPARFVLPDTHLSEVDVSAGTPGRTLHGNPQYGGGPISFMVFEVAALAIGMAYGALDVYGELMRSRRTAFPPVVGRAEDPDYQIWYGEATGMIATAEAALRDAVRQWNALCAAGPEAFTREQDLRLATICRQVIRLCWQAVERHLFPTAGSSAVRHGERLERIWRDMSMLHTHAGFAVFLPTRATREYTRAHFAVG
ncbi:acyl-CoA dehydrogenase family protein [Micromonospora sp. NRRL B-16802]|uniref:acyl-CoA dehydrogenase family protein n=1 Tax=unclassified Micromonospora TaxID=2617518 RepID=UPI0006AF1745|nr:acyl-CoA dehydrogenase family protein [Micromonospora sp. NRRL B-16802]KOX03153.1 acyl-CoA dehydrogenase [Micromonospora sp. NRRL B-16802]